MKLNKDKEINKIVAPIQKELNRLDQLPKKCFRKGCDLETIKKSHIVQENGIISKIAEDGWVYQLLGTWFDEFGYRFEKKEPSNAYTFKGFCSTHDAKIFEKIEKKEINFDDYHSQLLLSYRSLLYKVREKEISIGDSEYKLANKYYEKLNLSKEHQKLQLKAHIESMQQILEDKELIESNIDNENLKDYIFIKRHLPRLKIACSQSISFQNLDYNLRDYLKKFYPTYRIIGIFFNLIPGYNEDSVLLVGFPKKDQAQCLPYFEKMFASSENDLLKQINNILLTAGNDWICSPSVYLKYLRFHEKEIYKIVRQSEAIVYPPNVLRFNIFDYRFGTNLHR
jgi:hypothetical protein